MYKIFLSLIAAALFSAGFATTLTGLIGLLASAASNAGGLADRSEDLCHFSSILLIGLMFVPVAHTAAVIAREQSPPFPSHP